MALADVLTTYDRVALNLDKLDRVWQQIAALLPDGPLLGGGSPDEDQYQHLAETLAALRDSLPAINGWRITAEIVDYAAIGQARLDYLDIDEPEGLCAFNNKVYRHLGWKRRRTGASWRGRAKISFGSGRRILSRS